MKCKKWPFRPVHITNDGEKATSLSLLRKLIGDGIISNEHLQGIETAICAKLKYPTTIMEFPPERKGKAAEKVGPVRTDSPLMDQAKEPFGFHPPCRKFWEYNNGTECKKCDREHTILFKGLSRSNFSSEVNKRITENAYIQEYLSSELNVHIALKKKVKYWYLEYDCPVGYRELMFPVFFEDKVVGVFCTGQICLEKQLEFIRRKQVNYFTRNPNCFDEYCQAHGVTFGELRANIVMAHSGWVADDSYVLSNRQYDALITKACYQIRRLEETLDEQMLLQRERYIRVKIDKSIEGFRSGLSHNIPQDKDNLKLLWENVEAGMKNVIKDFAIRYLIVFGIKLRIPKMTSKLEVVAKTGDLPHELAAKIGSLSFNLENLPPEVRNKRCSSADREGGHKVLLGLEGFPGRVNRKTTLVRLFPVPFSEQGSIVVVIGYHESNPLTSIENKPREALDRDIEAFYGIVLSTFSAIWADGARKNLKTSLRILGHETGQLTAGLDWLSKLYLSNVEKLRNLPQEKAGDLCRDIDGYLGQLNFMFAQASMLTDPPVPRKHYFWAFRELLFKWKDVYRLEAEHKKLQFDMFYPDRRDRSRAKIYADEKLLEQLLYNVVNNAVKYSYRGTKIRIDCKKPTVGRGRPHILLITDYGREMKEGDWAYELYSRGENVTQEQGIGVGLYIARLIAERHGGQISHSCRQISPYNVPLIGNYVSKRFQGKDEKLVKCLREELDRIRVKCKIETEKIVALFEDRKPRYTPEDDELRENIETATYEVKFKVTIPPV